MGKSKIDNLLMAYKKEVNRDFRYIVRNGQKDLKILIKRLSEEGRVPYRELSLDVLGRLSPLKTQVKEKPKEKPVEDEDVNDGFQKQGSPRKEDNYIPKDRIFHNITSILNGFELQHKLQKKK